MLRALSGCQQFQNNGQWRQTLVDGIGISGNQGVKAKRIIGYLFTLNSFCSIPAKKSQVMTTVYQAPLRRSSPPALLKCQNTAARGIAPAS